jgi:Trypsin-co-occurring domain 1
MVELVRFNLGDDESIVAEVADTEPGIDRAARGSDHLKTAAASFEQVRTLATAAVHQLKDIAGPDEIELEFGIRLTVAAGAVLARTSVDGHIQARLLWKRPAPEAPSGA